MLLERSETAMLGNSCCYSVKNRTYLDYFSSTFVTTQLIQSLRLVLRVYPINSCDVLHQNSVKK